MAKWYPSNTLAQAISRLEAQNGGSLKKYGTREHLAVIRYLVEECAPDGKLDKAKLKLTFSIEDGFLGYASNAKKMLRDAELLPAGAPSSDEYE